MLEFGFSAANINPPMKMGLAGYFNTRIWTHVLDDLFVRAAVFRDGEKMRAFLIQYDLIVCPPELYNMVKNLLAENGFGDAVLLITATHCHTAPEVRRGRGGFCEEYLAFAAEKTLQAVRAAVENIAFCKEIRKGVVSDARNCFNRRFWMKDGCVQSNPGKLNKDILRPEGEIDPEIPLMLFEDEKGKQLFLASICNHADTTGGAAVSGDWPSWTRREVEKVLGAGNMFFPLIGCSGDINHFDVTIPGEQTEPAEAERIGKEYGESIIKGLGKLVFCKEGTVFSCKSMDFTVPSREIFPEELAEAEEIMEKYKDISFSPESIKNLTAEDFAKKNPVVLKYFAETLFERMKEKKEYTFSVTKLDFGENMIIGVPCEPFAATGLLLRKQICFGKNVLIAILNNGSGTGYFPNLWNYGRGGYETTPRSNQFSVHSAEKLLQTAAKLVTEK